MKQALTEAVREKTEAEELVDITVQKNKDEYEKKRSQLKIELEQAQALKRDSSAKRLETNE